MKVTAYKSKDGQLHATEADMIRYELELESQQSLIRLAEACANNWKPDPEHDTIRHRRVQFAKLLREVARTNANDLLVIALACGAKHEN